MQENTTTIYERSAFSLKEILVNMAISKLEAENIIREEKLKNGGKKFMNDLIRKIESIERDTRTLVGLDLATEIRNSISGNEDITLYQNVKHQILALNNDELLHIEEYIDHMTSKKFRTPTFEDLNDLNKSLNESIGCTSLEERLNRLKELGFDIVRVNQ